jgi:hypothetical protein
MGEDGKKGADSDLQVRIEQALNPAVLDRLLKDAPMELLISGYHEAMAAVAKGWITAAVCVGRAQEHDGYGDDVVGELAKAFEIGVRHLARLGQIYRDIIKPRIERDGDAAQFFLEEQGWYRVAIEASPKLDKPPVTLIEEAEEKKAADPKYSPTRWREDLGVDEDEGSTTSDAKSYFRQMKKLAKAGDSDADEVAVSLGKSRENLIVAEEALGFCKRVVDQMRATIEGTKA